MKFRHVTEQCTTALPKETLLEPLMNKILSGIALLLDIIFIFFPLWWINKGLTSLITLRFLFSLLSQALSGWKRTLKKK